MRMKSAAMLGLVMAVVVSTVGCSSGPRDPRLNAGALEYRNMPRPGTAARMPSMPMQPAAPPMGLMPPPPANGQIQQTTFYTPSEPRQEYFPLECEQYPMMEVVSSDPDVHRYPDEYLFDGGDRGMKVHYSRNMRLGVDTEDTFAEYLDHTGRKQVRASNPVAVYAPRFAAVRTMTGPEQDITIDRLAMASEANPGAAFSGRQTLATSNRRSKASGMRTRERGSELDTIDAGIAMLSREKAAGNVFVLKPLRRSSATAGMQFDHSNEAWLANRIQKAADWSLKSFPVVQAVNAAAMEMEASFKPQVHVHIDDEKAKGSLRVLKMVDLETAVPGDVLTFTIEFENIGDKELYNVRIIDNLTPRLRFIEDSAGADRKGRIIVEDTDQGTEMLIFELEGKLDGKAKGVVEFKARVM
ncbi:MAG: DUF11 domain-containing protein [Planctomycetaceae bacterium]